VSAYLINLAKGHGQFSRCGEIMALTPRAFHHTMGCRIDT
jgi:hypothetical protein